MIENSILKSKSIALLHFAFILSLAFSISTNTLYAQTYSTYTDKINKVTYKTVKIGNQIWMTENLNVTRFRNGDVIPQAKTIEEWRKAASEKRAVWCYYFQTEPKTVKIYNYWATVDPRGITPSGWRIPIKNDVNILSNDCCKLIEKNKIEENKQNDTSISETTEEFSEYTSSKYEIEENPGHELRTVGWNEGTNASGFNAQPFGGLSYTGKTFFPEAQWWLKKGPSELYICIMYINRGKMTYTENNRLYENGYAIRCIKED
jgi:uncharacterized protein (TIGR02145 family)